MVVKKWTIEEELKLKENYPLMGHRIIEMFPERTKSSILRKVSWLNLRVQTKQRKELRKDVVGFLDIEASGLMADFGIMYSWVIKEEGKNIYHQAVITREEILNGTLDKRLCQELVDTIKQFTLIYTFYGTKFDLKFIRTRCLMNGVDFIPRGECEHRDVYYLAKRTLKLHSTRLENVCTVLGIVGKTHMEQKLWIFSQELAINIK